MVMSLDTTESQSGYLSEQMKQLRQMQRICATAIVSMGKILADVKEQVGNKAFGVWCEKAGLSRTQRFRLLAVYNTLAEVLPDGADTIKRIRPTALYLLTADSAPSRLALQDAVHMLQNEPDTIVNTGIARDLIDSHKPIPAMTKKEIADLAPISRDEKKLAAPKPETYEDTAIAEALRLLMSQGNTSLTITATVDDENQMVTYCGIFLPDPERAAKRTHAVRATLEDLLPFLANTEQFKECRTCGAHKPRSQFVKDANQQDGKCPSCQECERPRVNAAKRRQRDRQKLAVASRTPQEPQQ